MTRIVFVNRFFHPDHSATSQLLTDLAIALAGSGHDVHVVTSRLRYDGTAEPLAASERVQGVTAHRVATTAFGRGTLIGRIVDYASFYVAAARMLSGLLGKGDVVVAKTDPPLISVPVGWVAARRGARLVNWVQDLYPETAQELGFKLLRGPIGALLRRLRTATLRDAAATVAVGERMAARLAAAGAPGETLHVIPNWVDEQALRPVPPADNRLRDEWGLAGRFVVAYSGNLGRAHEYRTLLDAAEILRPRRDLTFLFIGGGHGTRGLAQEVEARGLGDLFMFRPYQPQERLAQSLSVGDVHWVSLRSEMEGLIVPSKIYGIFAVGRPVIAVCAPDGELAEIVTRSASGCVVPLGDGTAFARAIAGLAEDHVARERCGSAARCEAEQGSSRASAIARWSAVIGAIPASHDAGPDARARSTT